MEMGIKMSGIWLDKSVPAYLWLLDEFYKCALIWLDLVPEVSRKDSDDCLRDAVN